MIYVSFVYQVTLGSGRVVEGVAVIGAVSAERFIAANHTEEGDGAEIIGEHRTLEAGDQFAQWYRSQLVT